MVLRKANTTAELGDQFALLVSGVVDYAIFMMDPAGRIVTWNEGAQRIKGYQAEEIIGRHFSVFYPAADTRIRKPDWELEVAKRDGRYEEEGWRIRKDGSRFWANVVITALRDETGRLRGFGKVTRDLTDRKAREDARNAEHAREEARLRSDADAGGGRSRSNRDGGGQPHRQRGEVLAPGWRGGVHGAEPGVRGCDDGEG